MSIKIKISENTGIMILYFVSGTVLKFNLIDYESSHETEDNKSHLIGYIEKVINLADGDTNYRMAEGDKSFLLQINDELIDHAELADKAA